MGLSFEEGEAEREGEEGGERRGEKRREATDTTPTALWSKQRNTANKNGFVNTVGFNVLDKTLRRYNLISCCCKGSELVLVGSFFLEKSSCKQAKGWNSINGELFIVLN